MCTDRQYKTSQYCEKVVIIWCDHIYKSATRWNKWALLRPTHCRKWQPSVTLLSCSPLITFLMSVIKSLKAGHVTCFRFPTTSLHFIHYLVWAIVGFFVFLRMIERSVVNTGTFSTLKTAFPGAPLPHITSKCFHSTDHFLRREMWETHQRFRKNRCWAIW